MKKRPAKIENPQTLSIDPYSCIDSGGWYMIFERPLVMSEIDREVPNIAQTSGDRKDEENTSLKVTKAINGGEKDKERRLQFTRDAKQVLL